MYKEIEIQKIRPPKEILRASISEQEIDELAESIKSLGLINPITVRPSRTEDGQYYEVVAGHRRYLACQRAGLKKVPCIVIEAHDDKELQIKLAENVARMNLSPVEEAAAVETLMKNYGVGIRTIARILGRSETWVRDRILILEMPPDVQLALHQGKINVSHAKILATVEDEALRQRYIEEVATSGISAKTLRQWCEVQVVENDALKEMVEIDEQKPRQDEPVVTYMITCMLCGQQNPVRSTRSIVVCTRCLEALMEARNELRNTYAGASCGLDHTPATESDDSKGKTCKA